MGRQRKRDFDWEESPDNPHRLRTNRRYLDRMGRIDAGLTGMDAEQADWEEGLEGDESDA